MQVHSMTVWNISIIKFENLWIRCHYMLLFGGGDFDKLSKHSADQLSAYLKNTTAHLITPLKTLLKLLNKGTKWIMRIDKLCNVCWVLPWLKLTEEGVHCLMPCGNHLIISSKLITGYVWSWRIEKLLKSPVFIVAPLQGLAPESYFCIIPHVELNNLMGHQNVIFVKWVTLILYIIPAWKCTL